MGTCFSTLAKASTTSGGRGGGGGGGSTPGHLTNSSNTNPTSTSTGSTAKSFSVVDSSMEESPNGRVLPSPNLKVFRFAELKAATKSFRPDSLIGEGGFGKVYKAWVDDKNLAPTKSGTGIAVAIKKLNRASMQGFEEWKSEVDFLGRLSHRNLVRLLGYCLEDRELLLVYEFMAKGSLDNHLFRRTGTGTGTGTGSSTIQPLSWDLRINIAIAAARGLVFLHTSNSRIIYRDFKASNILLDTNFNAKLSDFGLAKNGPTGKDSHVTTRIMGTYGYAAPEYLTTGHLYVKSDVYGFGVVLLEMLTGRRAHDPKRQYGYENLVVWATPMLSNKKRITSELIDPTLENQYEPKAAYLAAHIVLKCISSDHKKRPSMEQVLKCLLDIELLKVSKN